MAADGLPVVIRTIEGAALEVTLDRGAVPTRGFEVGVNLRTVETSYPGNSAKSVQIMGVEQEPIIVEGFLRDSWQGEAGAALRLRATMEALCLAQRLCQFEWGDTIVKRGYVKNFRAMPDKDTEWRYRLEFMVLESDDAVTIRAPQALPTATQSTLSKVLDAISEAEDALNQTVLATNAIQAIL